MIERLLTPRELAELSGIRESTLAAWRSRKTRGAPPFMKFGRLVRYRQSAVVRWLAEQEKASDLQPARAK